MAGANLSGSGGLDALIERIIAEAAGDAKPETPYEQAVWLRVSVYLRGRLKHELKATGLIMNCPRLDEGQCSYFNDADGR